MSLTTENKDKKSVDKAPPSIPEPERVLWYRLEKLKELLPDIDSKSVEELARDTQGAVIRDIEKWLEDGCSQELAAKIAKPL